MHHCGRILIAFIASIGMGAVAFPVTGHADEKLLWQVWSYHQQHLDEHAEVEEACRKVAEAAPGDPFTVVVRGIRAWHLLKMNRRADASGVLEAMLAPRTEVSGSTRATLPPLAEAGDTMARRWLTRLDREAVKQALKAYYAREVEFPDTLDAVWTLLPDLTAPKSDRWDKRWAYRPKALRTMPELTHQSYELQSVYLKEDSDFSDALARPYAGAINLTPGRLISATRGHETMMFTVPEASGDGSRNVTLTVGAESDGIFFASLSSALLVLSDGDHWKVMLKPGVKAGE